MSTDTKWIIGTMLAGMTAMTAVLLTVIVSLVSDVRDDVRELRSDVRADISDVRGDLARMDDRLRAVEISFGKVDQRLATLERLHLPTPPAD